MKNVINFQFTETSLNPSRLSVKVHNYIKLDEFLLKLNEYIYGLDRGAFTKDSLTEFLSPYGELAFSSTIKEEDVHITVNIRTKDIFFQKDFEFNQDVEEKGDVFENEEQQVVPKTEYQLFKEAVNEFRMSSTLISTQIDKITMQFYKIFIECEFFMYAYFDEYPEITRLEVYNIIQDGVMTHKEWVYNAITFMEQYVETIKKHFPKRSGKIFIHVPISEEKSALAKGAIYDENELLFYYTEEDDAYLFGRWLPIELNQYSEENENLNGKMDSSES